MTKQVINIGSQPGDNTGDPGRTAFDKCNQNFTELYALGNFGNGTLTTPTILNGIYTGGTSSALTALNGVYTGGTSSAMTSINGVYTGGTMSSGTFTGGTVTNATISNSVTDASLVNTSQIYAIDQTFNRTAAEIAASVTPTNYGYPPGDVRRYGADPTGTVDATTAFTNAQLSGNVLVRAPAGTYKLNNLRLKNGVIIQGDGYNSTIIKQANTTNPAFNVLSDASTGILQGVGIVSLQVQGLSASGAAAVVLQATTPYAVGFGNFDYYAINTASALSIVVTGANEVNGNKIKVISVNSYDTAFKTAGVYNYFNLEAVGTTTGLAISDSSLNSTFASLVTDGEIKITGQNCTFTNPAIESHTAATFPDSTAFYVTGYDHVLINPTITNVPSSTAQNSFQLFGKPTLINPRSWGASYPTYPMVIDSAASPTIINGDMLCTYKLEQFTTATTMAQVTLIGQSSTFSWRGINQYPNKPVTVTGTTYTVDAGFATTGFDYSIIVAASATCTLTLPSNANYVGRTLIVLTQAAFTVVSASSNVVPITGGAAGTAILAATAGKWATLQYNGTNWNIIASN